jgi:glycosyltransferase involved in cell wall biosynthesis
MRVGVIMYQTSNSKGQELVAQRMVKEFNRLGHDAYLITSAYHDWEPVVTEEEIAKRGGYTHTFEEGLEIPVLRVGSEVASWPPRRILFRNFVGVLTQIVSDLRLNVLITHSTLWNGPEEATKFVVWNRERSFEGAHNYPILLCQMSHFQAASDERYTVDERTFRETWNKISLVEILNHADFVIVTTPFEEEQMKKLGAADDKIVLFPGGIDDEIFETDENAGYFRKRLGLPSYVRLVTFLGTVEERKNVLSVLETAKGCADDGNLHFVIAGKLDSEYGEKVKTEAAGARNVSLVGEITDDEKAKLIDETFVNITMSRSEALGIAQLEFMYRGVPVVTSGVGGQSWLVKGGVNGIVLKGPDDVSGACAAITYLSHNSRYWKQLSRGAMKTSSEATLSNLVAGLVRKLTKRLASLERVTPIQEAKEKLVEARVRGGRKVAVTSKRLILSSGDSAKAIISIPFGEITEITRLAKRPRLILLLGLCLTIACLVLEVVFPDRIASLLQFLQLPSGGASPMSMLPQVALAFIPLFLSVLGFFAIAKDGFIIHYGQEKRVFLEREFLGALRIADSLTEKGLFINKKKDDQERPDKKQ